MVAVIIFIIIIALLLYGLLVEDKSDLVKLKEALKDTPTDDLKFINELISNELKNRT